MANRKLHASTYNVIEDPEGRYLMLDITIQNKHLLLVNIYGPNEDDPIFFQMIHNKIEHFQNSQVIAAGDFNVVQNYLKDTINVTNQNNKKAQEKVNDMKNDLDLVDPWRIMYPDSHMCSWHSKSKQSRIDYFLISETIMNEVENAIIKPGYRSDHSMVEIVFKFFDQKPGPGMWRFNNSMLRDPQFVHEMKECIKNTVQQYRNNNDNAGIPDEQASFVINDQLLFEIIKLQIRGKAIAYGSAMKKEQNKNEKEQENNFEKAYQAYISNPTDENLDRMKKIENQLKVIREKKIEGVMIRAKAKWHCEGEANSRYFLNLENKHYTEKKVHKLIKENGQETSKIEEILNEQEKYYKELYTSKIKPHQVEDNVTKEFFPVDPDLDHPKLLENDKINLEKEITLNECLKALKNMKNSKSPGADGITTEFYKFFWKDIGIYLLRSIKETYNKEKLSDYQRLGVITCLPKPGKTKEYIKNWRPISLLNIDYKILSTVLANRLKEPLQYLISSSQKGFLKNRNMSECTRLIFDIFHEMESRNMDGILLLIDYEKAFDSIEWGFIEKTLKYFQFGEQFIKWIKILYTDIESCILNNGHCSNRFLIERGVRQGDPLSPYLFILATEILTLALNRNEDIKGINIDNTVYLSSLYADDSSILLEDDEKSFLTCMKVLENFSKCSGLRINLNKTVAIKLGKNYNFYNTGVAKNINWQYRGTFKLLGIEFDLDRDDITITNYVKKEKEFKQTLNSWSTRNLTLYGRITIIKSLALPKLVHLFSSLPNPPKEVLRNLQSLCFNFIWKNTEKIKRTVLYNDYENGGLKVPNIEVFCDSLKICWIKQLLNDMNLTEWKLLLYTSIEKYGGNYIWMATENNPPFKKILNPFWTDVYDAWKKLTTRNSKNQENYLYQPIFYNKDIKIGGKSFFWKNWYDSGLHTLKDLVNDQGDIKTWETIRQQLRTSNNFLQHASLLRAIPPNWKKRIKEKSQDRMEQKHPIVIEIEKENKVTKLAYKKLSETVNTQPRDSQVKWCTILNSKEIKWEDIYKIPFSCTKEKKLLEMQYKILHHILPTNSFLFKCKLKESPNCTFCQVNKETIQHLMWECLCTKTLWLQLGEALQKQGIMYNFSEENTILGDIYATELIEHLKLITKQYIYIQKLKEQPLYINELLGIVEYKSNLEKYYNNKKEIYSRKWNVMENLFKRNV